MKRLTIVMVMLVSFLGVIGCAQSPSPQPDISRYTADQVIYIASANSPRSISSYAILSWTAEYMGKGVWLVTKKSVSKYSNDVLLAPTEQWYFYESTQKLVKQ